MKNDKISPSLKSIIMQKLITNKELNSILLETINAKNHYYHHSKTYFNVLYITGCRTKEPLDISRWSYHSNKVYLNTFKTEAIRIFEAKSLPEHFVNCIYKQIKPFDQLTTHQFNLDFRKSIPIHPIYSGDKIADTYLFRYNRAKLMYDEGMMIPAIQDFFGWNSDDVCRRYIMTQLILNTDIKLPF